MSKRKTLDRRRKKEALLFLFPWFIGTLIFLLIPVIYSMLISFSNIENYKSFQLDFPVLEHYHMIFFVDTGFMPYMLNAIKDTVVLSPLIIVFSLFISIILNKKIKCRGFFRAVFFLPVVLGTGFIMQELLSQGVQDAAMQTASQVILQKNVVLYLGPAGTEAVQDFLGLITTVFWKSGVQIVIFLAGLQKIPSSLYESARIDSATEWEMLWSITLPLMTPMILLNAIYTFIDFFTDSSNRVISLIQDYMFVGGDFERAAAAGWVYFTMIFVILGIIYLILRPFVKNAAY